jgi:uncharacterized protein YwgA
MSAEDDFSTLCNIWNDIGPFNMNLFSNRLILQKKIFLLQQLGFNLNYQFGKYIRGPYCSRLATDGYKINMLKNTGTGNISEVSLEKLKRLSESHENDPLWFELVSFIVYLKNVEKKNKDEIEQSIIKQKSYLFEKSRFEDAYRKLEQIEIISC